MRISETTTVIKLLLQQIQNSGTKTIHDHDDDHIVLLQIVLKVSLAKGRCNWASTRMLIDQPCEQTATGT